MVGVQEVGHHERLAACFDLTAALDNIDRIFESLDALPAVHA